MARPSIFTDDVAAAICDGLAEGLSLRKVCSQPGMPSRDTVLRWIRNKPAFEEQYALARAFYADMLMDEMIEIADDSSKDWRMGRNGPIFNAGSVQRAKLRIDTRKWKLARMAPKKYGRMSRRRSDSAPQVEVEIRTLPFAGYDA
jgi:hypothetical protein